MMFNSHQTKTPFLLYMFGCYISLAADIFLLFSLKNPLEIILKVWLSFGYYLVVFGAIFGQILVCFLINFQGN